MVSNTSPSPYVASASSFFSSDPAWRAFNGDPADTGWATAFGSAAPSSLEIDIATAWVPTSYSIAVCPDSADAGAAGRAPNAWTMQGSNDGSTWFTLDTRSAQSGWSAGGETRTFPVTGIIGYRNFRISISANNGDPSRTQIAELALYGNAPVVVLVPPLLYPFTQTISFRTVVGRFQNGAEQRSVAQPGGLVSFELPYQKLIQAQKDALKLAFTAAAGQFSTTVSLTLGATTYTNLSYDSDEFAATESKTTQYNAPLKLSQAITQTLSPGTAGLAFPALANGAMGILPYTQRKSFQTVATKLAAGPKWTTPEFAGGFAGYPTDGLMGWVLDEHMLTDADLATRIAHFVANWGRAFAFPFTDEDLVTYSKAHYSSDTLTIRYNDVNDSDVKTAIEVTF